jgi:REP element-mobilizing transposase RayT
MARFNRVVAVDIPHHVTQRGNGRRFILDCDADRTVYLKLLRENMKLYGVGVIGYCLMSNHVHLIATPTKADGLAEAPKHIHGRYACYWNVAHQSSGHVWQGRYYSCPLDPTHLWEALRYTELNPVRANWSQRRNSGPGQVQPVTAAAKSPMSIWLSMSGVAIGPLPLGGNTLREGKSNRSWPSFGKEHTQVGPWATRSLFKI